MTLKDPKVRERRFRLFWKFFLTYWTLYFLLGCFTGSTFTICYGIFWIALSLFFIYLNGGHLQFPNFFKKENDKDG